MSINVESGTTLTFEKFWAWLRAHTNCILRAGTEEVWLFDHEDLHWHLEEDAKRAPVVQVIQGKKLLAEVALDVRDVLFVQASPDEAEGAQGATLFEVVVGTKEETYTAYHFVLAHPFEQEEEGHTSSFKH
ncbi:MAG: hypothetical protein M3Y59_12250 [Myxococcota bacterium]|nr:hypothetical protein [Myxococcota bacterium]